MPAVLTRTISLAILGAMTASVAVVVALNAQLDIVLEMDRRLPGRVLTGVYPPETINGESFAWTSERGFLNVQGADRRMPWVCSVRFRGGRSAGQPQPDLSLVLDGVVLAVSTATNEYQTLEAILPPQSGRGIRLALTSSSTFEPGPSDPRKLGVRLDRLACSPQHGRFLLPPADTVGDAAIMAAAFGAMFAMVGAWPAATGGTLTLAVLQAVPLSTGLAPYTAYVDRSMFVALWISAVAAAGLWLVGRRQALSAGARFAVAFSAAALFLKLLMLLHPSKAPIDALFHAHRFDYVRTGHYFFTQGLPGGVAFPYSVALYVFALPWAAVTRDYESLLRIVVSASEAVAGLLWYWAIVSRWRDSSVAALAVVLFHLLPVSYWVIGNANLTQAFGQQAALVTMATLVAWPLGSRDWIQVLALSAAAATAFLSHVSTFMLLGPAIVGAGIITWWRGGREFFAPARSIVLASMIALAVSVVLYYGRPEFFPAYRSIRAAAPEQGATADPALSAEEARATRLEEGAIPVMTISARIGDAVGLIGDALSWPIVLLALAGGWRVFAHQQADRLTWTVLAWVLVAALFCGLSIVLPGRFGHQRQAWEFIARALYTSGPAVLVLAAAGAVWAWRAGATFRWAAALAVAWASVTAGRLWVNWIR
jgi:hypothetical protein